jgi:hypothetical protein
MVMPKTFNGITIQAEWLCRRNSTASPFNGYAEDIQRHNHAFNGYAEEIQRHNHLKVMPKTVNGITIQVELMVMPKTVNGITIQVE